MNFGIKFLFAFLCKIYSMFGQKQMNISNLRNEVHCLLRNQAVHKTWTTILVENILWRNVANIVTFQNLSHDQVFDPVSNQVITRNFENILHQIWHQMLKHDQIRDQINNGIRF